MLQAEPLEYESMSTMPPPPEPVAGGRLPLWLALDEVGGPMNLGALLTLALTLTLTPTPTLNRAPTLAPTLTLTLTLTLTRWETL